MIRSSRATPASAFSTIPKILITPLKWREGVRDRPMPDQEGREAMYRNRQAGGPDAKYRARR